MMRELLVRRQTYLGPPLQHTWSICLIWFAVFFEFYFKLGSSPKLKNGSSERSELFLARRSVCCRPAIQGMQACTITANREDPQ